MTPISFRISKKIKHQLGRAGVLSTPHGEIQTPAFITVGTKATVKAVETDDLGALGAQAVLANTYHLYLQPGNELVKKAGGLHDFMNWKGPIFTDSGGFQVFSLGSGFGKGVSKFASAENDGRHKNNNDKPAKITENGAEFKSYIDGSLHVLTPESSMKIQHDLGADIIFAFDECTSPQDKPEYLKEAMDRTHRWAKRSLDAHKKLTQTSLDPNANDLHLGRGLFGIVQGGNSKEMREESARIIGDMDFDGFGIGGSFTKDDLNSSLVAVNSILPEDKPRHLLGIGSEPIDFFVGVENGCDTFDCVAPTREARTGTIYTRDGKINILNAKYRDDITLLSEWSDAFNNTTYTRAYLAHLFRSKEILATTLASRINLRFVISLVDEIRKSILEDRYEAYKSEFLERYYH